MTSPLLTLARSLSFAEDRTMQLQSFSERDWEALLPLCDRTQLTLPIAVRGSNHLPETVRQRLVRNLADNAKRHQTALAACREVQKQFAQRGVQWIVLKGFSQQPHYSKHLDHRPQYDLDFYCPPESMAAALDAVTSLGYEPFRKMNSPTDHLPPLIRKTGWRPGNDYFDPTMPFTVELHHRLWDPETERFHSAPEAQLWSRRVTVQYAGLSFPALCEQDRLSYATWHLVRHLLRGDLRPYHAYELAHFLHATAQSDRWWSLWSDTVAGNNSSRQLAGIAFRTARDWFECNVHPEAAQVIQELPLAVNRWFDTFGCSPLTTWDRPNKNELFLHLSLVKGLHDRWLVTRRRLAPTRFQAPVLDAHTPKPDTALRWRRRVASVQFIGRRLAYHVRMLWPVLCSAARWARVLASPERPPSPRRLRAENAAR